MKFSTRYQRRKLARDFALIRATGVDPLNGDMRGKHLPIRWHQPEKWKVAVRKAAPSKKD